MTKLYDQTTFEAEVVRIAEHVFSPIVEKRINTIIEGKEYDAIFIGEFVVHAVEATVTSAADKTKNDLQKLLFITKSLEKEFRGSKAIRGCFVSISPLTYYQQEILKQYPSHIQHLSYHELLSKLIDTQRYLRARENHPFGSVQDPKTGSSVTSNDNFIPSYFVRIGKRKSNVQLPQILRWLSDGSIHRIIIEGDFGLGKSMHIKKAFEAIAKTHIAKQLSRFPVALNVREFSELQTPDEVFRRHANRIGVSDMGEKLIGAWKADQILLLIDGFDEIVPRSTVKDTQRLKDIRYQALQVVRLLVRESPPNTPIVITGRQHYFSSCGEMHESLGTTEQWEILRLVEFDENQLSQYLAKHDSSINIPEWLPRRPLLISYFLNTAIASDIESTRDLSASMGWNVLLDRICQREVEQISNLPLIPADLKLIYGGLAILARKRPSKLGPITLKDVAGIYADQFKDEPKGAALAQLMRLPGLISSGAPSLEHVGTTVNALSDGTKEFISEDLVDIASSNLLIDAIENFDHEKIKSCRGMIKALGVAGHENIVFNIRQRNFGEAYISRFLTFVNGIARDNVVQIDLITVFPDLGFNYIGQCINIENVIFDEFSLSEEHVNLDRVTIRNCYFETVNIPSLATPTISVKLEKCCIENL